MTTRISYVQAVFTALKSMPVKNDFYTKEQIREKMHRLYPNTIHLLHMTDRQLMRSLSYLFSRKVVDRKSLSDKNGQHTGYAYILVNENAVFGEQGKRLNFKHPVSTQMSDAFGSEILKHLVQLMNINTFYSSTTLQQMLKNHIGIEHPVPSIIGALETAANSRKETNTKRALKKLGVRVEALSRNDLSPAVLRNIPNSVKHRRFFRIVKDTETKVLDQFESGVETVPSAAPKKINDKTPLIEKVQFVIDLLEEVKAELETHQNAAKKLKELTELLNSSNIG